MTLYGSALAATLYGGSNVDGNGAWDTLLHQWFTDAFGGTPATRTPIDGDDVIDDGTFTIGPAVLVTLNSNDNSACVGNGFGNDQTPRDNIAVTASLNFRNGTWRTELKAGVSASLISTSFLCSITGNITGGSVSLTTTSTYGVVGMYGSLISGGYTALNMGGYGAASNSANITGGTFNMAGAVSGSYSVGNISNAVVNFSGTGGTYLYDGQGVRSIGIITNSKVSFDAASTYRTILVNGPAFITGTNSVLSYDGGATWMVATGLMPAASSVKAPAKTYNASGDAVVGTGGGLVFDPASPGF